MLTSGRTFQNLNALNHQLLVILILMIGLFQLGSSCCLLSESIQFSEQSNVNPTAAQTGHVSSRCECRAQTSTDLPHRSLDGEGILEGRLLVCVSSFLSLHTPSWAESVCCILLAVKGMATILVKLSQAHSAQACCPTCNVDYEHHRL